MLQPAKRQVQLFEMHFFTLFITLVVCYFPYETSMVEEQVSWFMFPHPYDIFPLFLCSPKPKEDPHCSLEMKLYSVSISLSLL